MKLSEMDQNDEHRLYRVAWRPLAAMGIFYLVAVGTLQFLQPIWLAAVGGAFTAMSLFDSWGRGWKRVLLGVAGTILSWIVACFGISWLAKTFDSPWYWLALLAIIVPLGHAKIERNPKKVEG